MQWHMPIGYKVIDGKITVYEEHRKIVEEIFRDYDSGVSAIRIASGLKARGITNAHDRVAWTHVSIGRILENHNYLGTEYYPQIIEKELFERVQKRREQARIESGKGQHRPDRDVRILFGGVLVCAECGAVYSHIQPNNKKRDGGTAKWKCKNYVYRNRLTCASGFLSDEQVKDVCVDVINRIIRDRKLIIPPGQEEGVVSAKYRELERSLEQAKSRQEQNATDWKLDGAKSEQIDAKEKTEPRVEKTDIMMLIYERAQERYRTLEIKDADFRTEEMQEILDGRDELEEFDEELYRRLIKQIVVYKDNTVKVVFLNGSSIKTGYAEE